TKTGAAISSSRDNNSTASLSNATLEAEAIAVRIPEVKLLHSVSRHLWRPQLHTSRSEKFICRIRIRTTEIKARVVVPSGSLRRWRCRFVAWFVLIIQHQTHAMPSQPDPARLVSVARVAYNFKSERVSIKRERSRHIEYL